MSKINMKECLAQETLFKELLVKYQTGDGLIRTQDLIIESTSGSKAIYFGAEERLRVFPVTKILPLYQKLIDKEYIWEHLALRLIHYPEIAGSAPSYGVSVPRALSELNNSGSKKAAFFLPNSAEQSSFKTLVISLTQKSDGNQQLQMWSYTPNLNIVDYIHALSMDFTEEVTHLDGATMRLSDTEIHDLLYKKGNVLGSEYCKYFRIDGSLKPVDMHLIASAFLPYQQLYEEAFEIEEPMMMQALD